jgi:hypothetical protein
MSKRWPHIKRFLRVESSGDVEDDFHWWWSAENTLSPAERTAANEEWADFYEWRFEQRADELAGDHHKRGLIEEWTDSMAYMCRRCAAFARGDDPGPWVPQWERRPDLAAAKRARVDEIIADLNAQQSAEAPDQYLRKVG